MASANLVRKENVSNGYSKFLAKHKWAHPTWIDIPDFLKYAWSVSHGEQHRLCVDINVEYNKHWFDIIAHNNGKHVNKLLDLFKRCNVQHNFSRVSRDDRDKKFGKHGLKAQAFEGLFSMPSTINETCKIFQDTGNKLNNCIDNVTNTVNDLTSKFDNILGQVLLNVQEKFNTLKWTFNIVGDWLPKIVLFFAKIFSMGYLLSQPCNQTFKNVAAIVALALPSTVGGNLEFISSLIRAIKGAIGNLQAQGEHDDSFIYSFYTLTKGVLSGIFSSVDKSAFDSMNISSKKVKLVTDYIRGATTIIDFLFKIFEKCIGFVSDKILKHYGVMPWFLKEDRISLLIDRFLDIKEKRLDQLCTTNRHAAFEVKQLYDDLIKVEASFVKQKSLSKEHNIKIMPYLRVMIRSLENVLQKIPNHLLSGKDMRRSKPFWIYIYGEPRIGKSAMFQPYLVNTLVHALGIRSQYEDYTNYTYFRNCGDKYWEKYSNHPVLWYNDLFQNYTDEDAMNLIIPELTAVIDDSLYPLNMAFEDKHGVYFNSDIVISNSQCDIVGMGFVKDKCLSQGDHLFARRNLVIEFCLNKHYLHSSGVGIDYVKMHERMIIGPNIGGDNPLFPEDMYFLMFHEPLTGDLCAVKTFKDGIQYIIDTAQAYRASQDIFKDKLYNHFKNLWAQAGDVDEPIDAVLDSAPCVFCGSLFEIKEYPKHIRDCSKNYTLLQQHEQWFDPSINIDPMRGMEDFMAAVMRCYPNMIDTPFMDFVKYSYSKGYEPIITALSQANFDITDSIEEQTAKILVIFEMAALQNWEEYYEDKRNPSYWKNFKKSFQFGWAKLVEYIRNFVIQHPIISYIILFMSYYTFFLGMFTLIGHVIKPYVPCAQTAEGDVKGKTKQIFRAKKNVDKTVAQNYDDQNIVVETKLRDHLCKFVVTVRDIEDEKDIDTRYFGAGLCVGSDVFVLPNHFWARWNEMRDFYATHGNKVVLHLLWGENKSVVVPWDVIKVWQPDYKHSEDIIFMRITKLIQLSHIEKFFIRVEDQPTMFEAYLYGLRRQDFTYSTVTVNNAECATNVIYTHEGRVEPLYNGKFVEREVHVPLCYKYKNCFTVGGDCGLVLIHADSHLNCRKIMGMHTAGSSKSGIGIASAIFYEDIVEAFEELYKQEVYIRLENDTIKLCDNVIAQSDEYKDLERTGVTIIGYKDHYDDFDVGVSKKFKITLPRKTKISRSVVYDIMKEDYGTSTVAPAKLKPFKYKDEFISPLYQGLKKISVCSNMVPQSEIEYVVDHMYDTIKSWVSPYSFMKILSDFEMVNGYGLLKPLDMTTSAGFPYMIIDNSSGKHPFFEQINNNPKQFEMKHIVRKYVEHREFLASKGIIMETFFIDTLKDEVRDLDKVECGKTRIFQVAPMDFNMLVRKYFGTFISFCHSTYLEGEMAIGINANSMEWTYMIKGLLQNSDTFINGDGKNFDASLGQQYMMEVCEVINRFYNDGEQNALIRRVLFATFMNSRHLVGNLVYMSRQGNKSGITLTTIFNNMASMFAIRLAYLRKYGNLYNFSKKISAKFYGDDDLISVKSHDCLIDSKFYQKIWKYLGVEYTAADKSENLLPYYSLEEISFLQRGFFLDKMYNVYLPRLCYDTILEIPRWSESDPYNMIDQMNRFNSALMEISNYGEVEFNGLRKHFVEYVTTLQEMGMTIKQTDLFTYQYVKELIFPELFSHGFLIKGQRDLLVHIDKCEQMLLSRGGGSE